MLICLEMSSKMSVARAGSGGDWPSSICVTLSSRPQVLELLNVLEETC